MPLAPGTRLGPYEVIAAIGAGGMGEVYEARDPRLNRTVAIKVLLDHISDHPEARARFEREAQLIAGLSHPHISTLHDIGRHEGTDYLVMELLQGETLAQRLERGPIPLDQALQYIGTA
jgi:serine/threonine protein kinase